MNPTRAPSFIFNVQTSYLSLAFFLFLSRIFVFMLDST